MIVVCAGNENGRKIGSYMKHTSRTHTHTHEQKSVCERKNHEAQASKLNGLYLLTVAKITARVFPTDIHKWYVS